MNIFRRATAGTTVLVAVGLLAACGGQQGGSAAGKDVDKASCQPGTGRLSIATGNSTGTYYVVGGGIAQLINDETELQASAAETGASVQNIQQLVGGEYDIAFSTGDTAADAVEGKADFDAPQEVSALTRLYQNYTHVVVRTDSGIDSVEDFAGKRISTGSPQSGTEVIANRLIEAAGLEVSDVKAQRLDATKTADGMKDGSLDGMVFSAGLPTPVVTDLVTSLGDKLKFLDVTPLLPKLQEINPVYEQGVFPADAYDQPADVPAVTVPNVLLARNDMPDNLGCALTKLIYDSKDKLAEVHPAMTALDVTTAGQTGPVPVHPGSRRAIDELAQ